MSIDTLTYHEAEALLGCIKDDWQIERSCLKRQRNHIMALLMLDAGLRVGEVARLKIKNFMFAGLIAKSITISKDISKNKVPRVIPMTCRLRDSLIDMTQTWWEGMLAVDDHYAFWAWQPQEHIGTRQIQRIIRKASQKAIARRIHPHVLRHTFATRLMRQVSIRVVQELLGHKRLSSTQIYTHPNNNDLEKAIGTLNDPAC